MQFLNVITIVQVMAGMHELYVGYLECRHFAGVQCIINVIIHFCCIHKGYAIATCTCTLTQEG